MSAENNTRRHVLVVDRDDADRLYASMLLQRFGYDVTSACSLEKALEFMTVEPASAIVADIDKNGSAIVSSLTQDPRFFDIPLILVSWWSNEELEDRRRRGELIAFLRKPIRPEQLYLSIQTATEASPRRNIRIEASLDGWIEGEREGSEGLVTSLSEHGMFFRTIEPHSRGELLQVVFTLGARSLAAEASVLYVIPFDEGPFKTPGIGLRFVKITREDRQQIAGFIQERIGQGLPRGSSHEDQEQRFIPTSE